MKKIIGSMGIFLIISCTLAAQGNKEEIREKIRAKRIAFITDKLALTAEEAQGFWPLYNAFKKKERTIKKEAGRMKNIDALTDAEVEALVDKQLEKEEQLFAAKRIFIQDVKDVLPIKKVAKLSRVERKFKEMVLQRSRAKTKGY